MTTLLDPECPLCSDTGFAEVERPDSTVRWVRQCPCVQQRQTRQFLATAGIQAKYQHCTFANFAPYNDSLEDALLFARTLAEAFPVLPRQDRGAVGQGLLFSGPAGTGKTHLAVAILKTIIERTGKRGLFYKTRDLLHLIRQSYNATTQTSETQVLQPILTCDLLVLDDLGAERVTEWVAETMDRIIDTRYSEDRPLIATTNFPDLDDPKDPNGLMARIGFRMRSRLYEMCREIVMVGHDYRQPPINSGEGALRVLGEARPLIDPARDLRKGPRPRRAPTNEKADVNWPGGKGGNT